MKNGLEKILQKIDNDCRLECDDIMNKAKEEATIIGEETVKAATKKKVEIIQKAKVNLLNKKEIASKGNALDKRNSILKAKNMYIDEVINAALTKVRSFDDAQFLDLIRHLIIKYSVSGSGIIHFSKKDSKRIHLSFIDNINAELAPMGRSLIKGNDLNIEDGFILEYKDIDINCTSQSLLRAFEDEIRAGVYNELFGG